MKLSECRVGMGVVYRPHEGAPAEDGTITEVRNEVVMVLFAGDRSAKACYPSTLSPLRIDS